MNCPVCPQTNLPVDARTCPNCGVELAPLRRLEQLPDHYFNEALALAARGEPTQAAEKVAAAIELGAPAVRARLLLGKLLWNLGRCDEARDSWRHVLDADPNQSEAKRLLEMAGNASAPVAPAAPTALLLLAGVLLLVFVALLLFHLSYRGSHSYTNAEVALLQLHRPPANGVRASLANLVTTLNRHASISARQDGDRLVVMFREGLFGGGSDRLVPSAADQLRSLAATLEQHCRGCRVVVEGVTDSSPLPPRSRWGENSGLGLARARRAVEHLRGQSTSSQLEWLAITSGHSHPPFPNDTLSNRAKNRTVVLHVWQPAVHRGGP